MSAKRTCFIVMPIGDQNFGDVKISASELKERYDNLIREALLRADPNLDITRADDVPIPGTITSDILTRIMHSDLVVADVTFPNPNVFYELGLRHACRVGTIIIRDRTGPRVPFDISHLRNIEYENTPTGLKDLAGRLQSVLNHFSMNHDSTDNQFQELAKLTHYAFPDYHDKSTEIDHNEEAIFAMMQSPELLNLFARSSSGEPTNPAEFMAVIASNPNLAAALSRALAKSGRLSFGLPSNPALRKKAAKKRRR